MYSNEIIQPPVRFTNVEFKQVRRRRQIKGKVDQKGNRSNDKTTILHVHHAFLNISSPLLYDFNEKLSTVTTLAPEVRSQNT